MLLQLIYTIPVCALCCNVPYVYIGSLTVIAYNNSDSNTHVQKATINGKAIDLKGHPFVDHKDIANGGMLEFWMQLP